MATDKQQVNEAVVEKLCSKLDLRFLKQFSVFLVKYVNLHVVVIFNNSQSVNANKGIPSLRVSVYYWTISV